MFNNFSKNLQEYRSVFIWKVDMGVVAALGAAWCFFFGTFALENSCISGRKL